MGFLDQGSLEKKALTLGMSVTECWTMTILVKSMAAGTEGSA